MNLAHLLLAPGERIPPAWKQNELLKHLLRSRFLGGIPIAKPARPFGHPWRVRADRFAPPPGSPLDPDRAWTATIAPGTVNDDPPSILYLAKDDPRGWTPSVNQLSAISPQPSAFIERDLLDGLPDDPPWLLLSAPAINASAGALQHGDFSAVADAGRLDFFRTAEMWDKQLFSARVILSAAPVKIGAFDPRLPAPRLKRFRLYTTPVLPGRAFGAQAGGWIEIARLWLTRDDNATGADGDEMYVEQKVFWDLQTAVVQPSLDSVGLGGAAIQAGDAVSQAFTDLLVGEVGNILDEASFAAFWT
jgi:hypothetical protein